MVGTIPIYPTGRRLATGEAVCGFGRRCQLDRMSKEVKAQSGRLLEDCRAH